MAFLGFPFLARCGNRPAYWQPSTLYQILATGVQTDNRLSVVHQTIYKDNWKQGSQSHNQDRGIYILKGECIFDFEGGKEVYVKENSLVAIPKLVKHSFHTVSAQTELLLYHSPAGFEQVVTGSSIPAIEIGPPPSNIAPPPKKHVDILHEQYGIKLFSEVDENVEDSMTASHAQPALDLLGLHNDPFIATRDAAPAFWVKPMVPELWILLASTSKTNSVYTLTEMVINSQGVTCPLISYTEQDEVTYVKEGKATVLLDHKIEEVSAGDFLFVPKGHTFSIRADSERIKCLVWHTPSGIIEGSLPLLGGRPAEDRETPPTDLEGALSDPEPVMAQMMAMGVRIVGAANSLQSS